MNATIIRPATARDLTALAPRLASLPLFTAYGMGAEKLARRWTEGLEKGDPLLVAERPDGGALFGMCWYLRRGVFGTGGYLRTIALVPEAHGHGVGQLLLRAYEKGCDNPSGGWFLLTSDFNDGAQRFYKRHGYTEVGRLPGYAAPHITELVFWKARPAT